MLAVRELTAGYGRLRVLHGIDFDIAPGEVVTLLGRNGMGKSTFIRALMGMVPVDGGRIAFCGEDLRGRSPERIARVGMGLVPERRRIFSALTVRENLLAGASRRAGSGEPWTLERVLALFPRLAERLDALGPTLSGGEQQMLAIGRALMTNPRLLLLDEATEGLAPLVRTEIWATLTRLKAAGLAIIVVDKHVDALLALADRHTFVEKGQMVWNGSSDALRAAPEIATRYLGV